MPGLEELCIEYISLLYLPHFRYSFFFSTKTEARVRIGDGSRASVLSFGTAGSLSNQVKSWHK